MYYLSVLDEYGTKAYWSGKDITLLRRKAKEYRTHYACQKALHMIRDNRINKFLDKMMIDFD